MQFLFHFGCKASVVKLGEHLPDGNLDMATVVLRSYCDEESIAGALGQATY
jgi:hypothetical protein